jgi:hypothetical protein
VLLCVMADLYRKEELGPKVTIVSLLFHCCCTSVTLVLHWCHTVVTLFLLRCYTVVTLLRWQTYIERRN